MNEQDQMQSSLELSKDEQELIAFHLGEACDEAAIRSRLHSDETYAQLSESINYTLRVFSAEDVPAPDTEAAWQRLSSTLPVLERKATARPWRWLVLAPTVVFAILLVAVGLVLPHFFNKTAEPQEAETIHLRPPIKSADLQDVSTHLDRAERWLTVVNHSTAPLDKETRVEGEQLLTRNAVYLRDARSRGDLSDALALERLERAFTTAKNSAQGGVQLRVEMNTDGLLFDLRILSQNHSHFTGEPQ